MANPTSTAVIPDERRDLVICVNHKKCNRDSCRHGIKHTKNEDCEKHCNGIPLEVDTNCLPIKGE